MKTLLCATGVTLLFAGLLAFFYGYGTQFQYPYIRIGASAVRTQYICIAGAVVAVVGAGVTVMGLMRSKG